MGELDFMTINLLIYLLTYIYINVKYLSLNSKYINNQRRQTNILTNEFKTNYLEVGTTTGVDGGTNSGNSSI